MNATHRASCTTTASVVDIAEFVSSKASASIETARQPRGPPAHTTGVADIDASAPLISVAASLVVAPTLAQSVSTGR